MTQRELGLTYEVEKHGEGMTVIAGMRTCIDLACRSGMVISIERNVKARQGNQGWMDAEMILSQVMLNLVAG